MPNTLVYPSKHHLLYTFIRPTDQEGYQLSQDFQIGSCVYIAWVKPHSWSQLFVGHQSQQGPNRRCLDIQNDMITSCKVAVSLANNNDIPNFAVPVTDKYSLSPAMPQKLRRHVHEHIRQHHLKQRNQTSPIFSHRGNLTHISTLKGYKKRLFWAEIFVSMLWNFRIHAIHEKETRHLLKSLKRILYFHLEVKLLFIFLPAFNFLCSCICSCKILRKPVHEADDKVWKLHSIVLTFLPIFF